MPVSATNNPSRAPFLHRRLLPLIRQGVLRHLLLRLVTSSSRQLAVAVVEGVAAAFEGATKEEISSRTCMPRLPFMAATARHSSSSHNPAGGPNSRMSGDRDLHLLRIVLVQFLHLLCVRSVILQVIRLLRVHLVLFKLKLLPWLSLPETLSGKVLLQASSNGSVYPISFTHPSPVALISHVALGPVWHRRLGHCGRSSILDKLKKSGTISSTSSFSLDCISCRLGKSQ
ncbi:unnamed protein product [Cuscuta europaea]|uniref:GAG-pre-integrase domain-containing protein n=1 Tax=Cuscuta europaea TaxID=41803 RepID=A0A9P0ZEQ2_CUSEU|nr:unnamed protein product [Cuscuta europaea]CAH9097371.1 unnamed protein product [Cuscuta europaea]CAH9097377.1 unnamed protein product [Cuscuta europaea]